MVIKKQVCNMVSSLLKYNNFKLKVQWKFLSIQSCQPEPTFPAIRKIQIFCLEFVNALLWLGKPIISWLLVRLRIDSSQADIVMYDHTNAWMWLVCFGIKITWNIKKKKNQKSYLYTRIMIESVKSLYNQFGDRAELYSIKYHDKIKM